MPKKKTQEQWEKEVEEMYPNGKYSFLEQYINDGTKILCQCNTCSNKWYIRPNDFLHGYGCPECAKVRVGKKGRKTNEQFLLELRDKYKDEYVPLEKYKKSDVKIKFKHKKCGKIFKISPNSLLRGGTCSYCSKTRRLSTEEFQKKIKQITQGEYFVKGTYINNRAKMKFTHISCGKSFYTKPNWFLNGNRCPFCATISRLEKYTLKYLDKHSIKYIAQHRFFECKDRYPLPFDFYLPELGIPIECQGKQHYEYNSFFGGVTGFAREQLHDRIKRNYAKDNGLVELEIPYTENSYEKLFTYLDNELLVFGGNL